MVIAMLAMEFVVVVALLLVVVLLSLLSVLLLSCSPDPWSRYGRG